MTHFYPERRGWPRGTGPGDDVGSRDLFEGPVGDFHSWVRPPSPPCPDCECCSAALCQKAKDDNTKCWIVGAQGDFDLTKCPCAPAAG